MALKKERLSPNDLLFISSSASEKVEKPPDIIFSISKRVKKSQNFQGLEKSKHFYIVSGTVS